MEGNLKFEKETVCVTGAGGYVASWVVKDLLSKGYIVHGTVRDPSDEKKNGHLLKLENAAENLKLFKADLLNYEALCAAIQGCTGVFHVACPVPGGQEVVNPEEDMLQPAITGTLNVLKACSKANVKKVVVVSSVAAVLVTPNWPKDQPMDETCWTDVEFCKTVTFEYQNWYAIAKTIAEKEAWDYAKNNGLNMVTICPSVVIGPMLQSTLNASSMFVLQYLKDAKETVQNGDPALVDVRDVSEAILLAYEKPEAEGRYICSSFTMSVKDFVGKLQKLFPDYKYPTSFTEVEKLGSGILSSKKLETLGWKIKPLEETLTDTVKNFEENGLLV